jgi:hypothetical protein
MMRATRQLKFEPAKRGQSSDGSLISDADARALSLRLSQLGDQWQEICAELEAAGYGLPSALYRTALESLADTEANRSRLRDYWRESAKERLGALVGPVNIRKGRYPPNSAYRSDLIARLREDVTSGRVHIKGRISSPEIEPTLKSFLEMGDTSLSAKLENESALARRRSASALGLPEDGTFADLDADAKYELLISRYCSCLNQAGFKVDSHRKTGTVYRKPTTDGGLDFLLVDNSREINIEVGVLSTMFALTLPNKGLLPNAISLGAVASFAPEVLVPRFRSSSKFEPASFAEFCLAADSIAFLTKSVYRRIDTLLVG